MEKDLTKKQNDQGEKEFIEQEAPEKNTDNAFVKVGSDGQPELPKEKTEEKEEPGSLRHR